MIPADDRPYRNLQKHLNRQPIGFPPSRTGADIRLLKHIFSPDEARLAACLSHIPETLDIIYSREIDFLCSCCGCCCSMLSLQKELPLPLDFWDANFQAVLDTETCVGCGTCVKKCPTNAMTLKTVDEKRSKAVINRHRCIGCGHCVTSCPVNAVTLMPRKHQVQPPKNRDELNTILLKEKQHMLAPVKVIGKLAKGIAVTRDLRLLQNSE